MTSEETRLLKENNMMLKAICTYLANEAAGADRENRNDFFMNVLANIISNRVEPFSKK